MSTKHLFNSADGLVQKALQGVVLANPTLRIHTSAKIVYLPKRSNNCKVAVISGGGAGHEPAFGGYTGKGMLTAAVSGDIFASPSAAQVLTAIELACTSGAREILLVVNNYTGDILNFGLAAEQARARGISVETVINADDVAVGRTRAGRVGRRGLAAIVFIIKILGAAAERGFVLGQLKRLGDDVASNIASVGASLEHCHVPGRSADTHTVMEHGTVELGMGIHNEPGVRKVKVEKGAPDLVTEMLLMILNGSDPERGYVRFNKGDQIVLFVSNLGGLSSLEFSAVVHETVAQLQERGYHPSRVYASAYMTSLNGPGFSISLLNLTSLPGSPNVLTLLDDTTEAHSWAGVRSEAWIQRRDFAAEDREILENVLPKQQSADESIKPGDKHSNPALVEKAIRGACRAVTEAEPELTRFDTVCGDGDCGETFAAGAKAIVAALDQKRVDLGYSAKTAGGLAKVLESAMGGTSGALFALYFTSLCTALQSQSWSAAANKALTSLNSYTPARPGDRTLVDALFPFARALGEGKSIEQAAQAARNGAESTKGMRPRLGRAVYVNEGNAQGDIPGMELPDPGAWGVAAIAEGIARGMSGK